MQDVFDFVEQFLGTAGTECRNEEGAMVSQGLICCLLEPLLAVSVVFMQARRRYFPAPGCRHALAI